MQSGRLFQLFLQPMSHLRNIIVAGFYLMGLGMSLPASAQPDILPETTSSSLKFIDDIEITPRTNKLQKTKWKQGGTALYASGTELISIISTPILSSIEQCQPIHFKYAQLLDVSVEQVNWENTWFEFLEKTIGTPYQFGGSDLTGIDCSGFSGMLYAELFEISLPRSSRDQAENCVFLPADSLRKGDLLFFKNNRHISHVGVYLDNGFFVHASTQQGVTISHLNEPYYQKRFYKGGRYSPVPLTPQLVSENRDEP
jgi:cell wall-associated NlpC family hydrolase